jgi:hypothetical protein
VRPGNVVDVLIDRASGLLAAPEASKDSFYTEVFIAGTAPTEVAPAAGDVTAETVITGEYQD